MSDDSSRKNERSEDEVPQDDQGIRNDEIIQIIEEIVKQTWHDVCCQQEKLDIDARKKVAETMHIVWSLARDMMDADDQMRVMQDFFSQFSVDYDNDIDDDIDDDDIDDDDIDDDDIDDLTGY